MKQRLGIAQALMGDPELIILDILITNGFTEGFDLILASATEKGDKILCENPTHNTAIKIMKLHGLEIKGIDVDKDGINYTYN